MLNIEIIRKCLQEDINIELYASGNSMFPMIKEGDKIIVKKLSDPIKVNDIVLYFENAEQCSLLVAHRVVNIITDQFYITKGDNNNYIDKPVRRRNILGKVIEISRQAT